MMSTELSTWGYREGQLWHISICTAREQYLQKQVLHKTPISSKCISTMLHGFFRLVFL